MTELDTPTFPFTMFLWYLFTIAIETTILWFFLSRRHSVWVRIKAGIWLSACTYPIVWMTLPAIFFARPRWEYLLVAETFAPAAECFLFWFTFIRGLPNNPRATCRDMIVITLANLASFLIGEMIPEKAPTENPAQQRVESSDAHPLGSIRRGEFFSTDDV